MTVKTSAKIGDQGKTEMMGRLFMTGGILFAFYKRQSEATPYLSIILCSFR